MAATDRRRVRRATAVLLPLAVLAACTTSPAGPAGDAAPSAAGTTPTTTPTTTARPGATPSPPRDQAALDRRLRDAAWANDVALAARLIGQGANVNAKDTTQQSAYLIATSEGFLDLLDLTLAHGADVGAKDSFNGTGAIRAGERGHTNVVGRLIGKGVDIDHVNRLGWTALHEAIILGDGSPRYVDTVRVLVAGGADVALPSRDDGVTPLQHARRKGYAPIATTLQAAAAQDAAAKPPVAEANRRLLAAAASGDADAAALAVRAGAQLEARDAQGRTPLLVSVTEDRVDAAKVLLALGADPDALDGRHDTPWLVTGVTGSVPMLEVLLPAHPDLTIRNRFGGLSVIPASERGHVDYVRRVAQTGIDVNHVNDLGWTAMLEAVILGDGSAPYQQIVQALLAAGADRSIADKNGVTALQHAQRRGMTGLAAILRG